MCTGTGTQHKKGERKFFIDHNNYNINDRERATPRQIAYSVVSGYRLKSKENRFIYVLILGAELLIET